MTEEEDRAAKWAESKLRFEQRFPGGWTQFIDESEFTSDQAEAVIEFYNADVDSPRGERAFAELVRLGVWSSPQRMQEIFQVLLDSDALTKYVMDPDDPRLATTE